VYGVVAYSVRQRTVEIGTRMALGATGGDLMGLVVGDGLKMAGSGVAIGLITVLVLARTLDTSGLGIQSPSAWPFVIAVAAIGGFTALACLVPAWRATLLSPLVAIRDDPESAWKQAHRGYRRLAERMAHMVARPRPVAGEIELLAAMVDASSRAESFAEAIQSALESLRRTLGAESAALLVQPAPGEPYRAMAAAPDAFEPHHTLPADAVLLNQLRHYSSALPIAGDDLDTWTRWAREQAPAHAGEMQTLREMGVALAAPVMVKSEMAGVLLLGRPVDRPEYASAERRALRSVGAQFALLIENGRLTGRIVEQERLRRELQVAAEVQRRLFPEKSPETAAVHCAGVCMPARGVGGDYYDFLDLTDDTGRRQIGVALADVAGKGIAAALLMSVVQASLRSLADTGAASLAELAAKMNRLLHRSTGSSSYATFFYAQFDEGTRRLRYVNAGHNPPYVLRADGTIEELPAGGTIIGMFAQSRYEEAALDLAPGDVLIAFSDGVTEAMSPGEEEFGEERLKDALRRIGSLPVNEMASSLLEELKTWMADAPQHDDLTFVVMKVR
jgi:sigma-B regulation protein RsbU (phosphoserine phosphatase)